MSGISVLLPQVVVALNAVTEAEASFPIAVPV